LARVEEARSLALRLSSGLASVTARLQAIGPALLEDAPDIDAAFQRVSASHTRIASNGFSRNELRMLRNMGLGQAEIDAALARVLGYSSSDLYNPSVAGFDAAVAALAQQGNETGDALQDAAVALGDLAEQLRSEYPDADAAVPVISIDGPESGVVGSSLNFRANAPASLTLNWDLHAFGTFGDGGGDSAEVTYRLPGERVISLRATGPGIVPVVATALVTIADDNAPPSFESALPDPAVQWIQSGQDLAFAVQTSDSDGDPVSVTWLLDGVEVASGEQWSTSFSEAEWGQHHVSAIASDGRRGHDVTHDFLVLVRGPDADGDGWSDTAQGDCDDADPGINPEAIERLLNGKDDDCDPATTERQHQWLGSATPCRSRSGSPMPGLCAETGASPTTRARAVLARCPGPA
jgi:hypothetical protein